MVLLATLVVSCENLILEEETTNEQDGGDGDDTGDGTGTTDEETPGCTSVDVSGTIQGLVDPYTGDVSTYDPDEITDLPAGTYFVGLESEKGDASWYPDSQQNQVDSDDEFSFTLPVPAAGELLTATDAFGSGISTNNSDARFDLAYFGVGTSEEEGLSLSYAKREGDGTITFVQYIYASAAATLSGSSTGDAGTDQYSVSLEAGWNPVVASGTLGTGLFGQLYDIQYTDTSMPTGLQWLIVDDVVKIVSPALSFEHVEQQGSEFDTEILITQGADDEANPSTAELYISFGIWHTNESPVVPDGTYTLNTSGSTGDGARMGAIYMGSDAVESSPPDFDALITENAQTDLESGSVTYNSYLQATAGTVTVAAQGSGSYTVSWELTLSDGQTINGEATAAAELDWGDLGDNTVTALTYGETETEEFRGRNDHDWFSFFGAGAGTYVIAVADEWSNYSGNADVIIEILDAGPGGDGSVLETGPDETDKTANPIQFTPESGATYYIKATSSNPGDTSYQITVTEQAET
jgi:hypothetical protein